MGYVADGKWTKENGVDEYVWHKRRDSEPVQVFDDVGVHRCRSCDGNLEKFNFGGPHHSFLRANLAAAENSVLDDHGDFPVTLGMVRDLLFQECCCSVVAIALVFDGDAEWDFFSDAVAGSGQLQCGGDGP